MKKLAASISIILMSLFFLSSTRLSAHDDCGIKADGLYHCGTNCGIKQDGKFHCGHNCGIKADGKFHCEDEG